MKTWAWHRWRDLTAGCVMFVGLWVRGDRDMMRVFWQHRYDDPEEVARLLADLD